MILQRALELFIHRQQLQKSMNRRRYTQARFGGPCRGRTYSPLIKRLSFPPSLVTKLSQLGGSIAAPAKPPKGFTSRLGLLPLL
jgi:hypothetical protein